MAVTMNKFLIIDFFDLLTKLMQKLNYLLEYIELCILEENQ